MGLTLAVDFVDRLRETRTFVGVEDLVEQLKKDVDAASQLVGESPSESPGQSSNDLNDRVTRFLREEVAPVLQMDGSDVHLLEIQDGVAKVRIQGGCDGCPSSLMAVIMGLEQELRREIPEIEYLEIVP